MLVYWSAELGGLYRSEHCYASTTYWTVHQVLSLPSPFSGTWTLGFDGDSLRLLLSWEISNAAYKPIKVGGGTIVTTHGDIQLWSMDIPAGNFPPSPSGVYKSEQLSTRYQQVKLSITLFHPAESQWDLPKLVEQTASSLTSLSPNNVRLFFPRSGRSLYANETFLSNSSPYFKTLFEAGFSEDDKVGTEPVAHGDAGELPPYTFDDSDDETDHLLDKPALSSDAPPLPCKTVTITDTSYSTYFAVLVWLVTGKITFAPSRSSRSRPPPRSAFARSSSASARRNTIQALIRSESAFVPPPVSAKSVYRLAHLLELDSLASLALSEMRSQLTIKNVAYTLYSDIASAYPEVQSAALDFATEKWEKVVGAEATSEMERLAEGGEADSAMAATAATAMKLAKRLAGRIK